MNDSVTPMVAGARFNEWTVIDPGRRIAGNGRTRAAALVHCSCGTEKVVHQDHLRSGNTKSCGHYKDAGNWRQRGGPSRHPLYPTWLRSRAAMCEEWQQDPAAFYAWAEANPKARGTRLLPTDASKPTGPGNVGWGRLPRTRRVPGQVDPVRRDIRHCWNSIKLRCFNPNTQSYPAYGGRGITLWEPWRDDSNAFINWVVENLGPRPADPPGHVSRNPYWTLDRIDVNGDYAPGNLRWASPTQQAENTRAQLSTFYGIEAVSGSQTWRYRIMRGGRRYSESGFATPEDAGKARDALLAKLARPKRTVLYRRAS